MVLTNRCNGPTSAGSDQVGQVESRGPLHPTRIKPLTTSWYFRRISSMGKMTKLLGGLTYHVIYLWMRESRSFETDQSEKTNSEL